MTINVSLNTVGNLQDTTTAQTNINANSTAIEGGFTTALNTTGDQMKGNLDMNSNQILNLPAPATANSPARLVDIVSASTAITVPPVGTSGAVVGLLNANKTDSGNNTFSGTNTFATISGSLVFTGSAAFSGPNPWYDITAYGAVAGGVTDCTTAFQTALNAASSLQGVVYVPPGKYKVSSTLTVPAYVSVRGDGKNSSQILPYQTSGDVFYCPNAGARFVDLQVYNVSGSIPTSGYIIDSTNTAGASLFVSNCIFGNYYNGINCQSGDSYINQVQIGDMYGTVGINGTAFITNCLLNNPSLTNYTAGSGFNNWANNTSYSTGTVVQSNGGYLVCSVGGLSAATGSGPGVTVFNTATTDGTAQWLYMCRNNYVKVSCASDSWLRGNDITGACQYGVQIGTSNTVKLSENNISNCIGAGVALTASTFMTVITGNFFNGIFGNGSTSLGYGISAAQGGTQNFGTVISQNTFNNIAGVAIYTNGSNQTVTDNFINGYANTATNSYAIILGTSSINCVVSGNNIVPGVSSIQVAGVDYINVVNNIVHGVSVVNSSTGSHTTITGNV
jgi:hypothetical protein